MNTFHVKILTKLGSTQYKEIEAESATQALKKAKARFPLHKEIEIVESTPQKIAAPEQDPEYERKLAEIKLSAREKKARAAKKEGLGFVLGGVLIQTGLILFTGYVIIWLAIPIIWGVTRIAYGSAELRRVKEEQQAAKE